MSTNRKREILELLESGKITAEEAVEMLSGADTETAEAPAPEKLELAPEPVKVSVGGNGPSTFHVRVRNLETGQNKVTVNIPLRMLKFGLKLGGRFSPELEGINLNEMSEMMVGMDSGMLVEVQDEEGNEHVQVYID